MPLLGWYLVWPILGGLGLMLLLGSLPWGAPRPTLDEWLERMDVRRREAERARRLDPPPAMVPWPAIDRLLRPMFADLAAGLGAWQTRLGLGGGPEHQRDILRAYPGMTPYRWLGYRLVVAAICGALAPLLIQLAHAAHLSAGFLELVPAWVWVGTGAWGFIWPEHAARRKLRERRDWLRSALPAFLGTLYIGASAGLSLQACLRYVAAQQASGPLGAAIVEMLHALDGRQYTTLEQALRGLGAACATPELDRVVGRLAGNTAAGAPLTAALRELAAAQRADDRAALVAHGQRQAIKMLGAVALFLVPPLLVVFLYPVMVLVHSL